MTQHLYPLISYCHKIDQCRRALMSRYFGEQLSAAQCGQMCDVCDRQAAGSAAGVSPIVEHDLSEAAVQMCEYVEAHGGGGEQASRGKGKRKRASDSGSLTQKKLVDDARKKGSGFALPKSFSRDDCERLVVELMLQGVLREKFRTTAYATNSYLEVDPNVAQLLRRGDMLIRLKCVDHKWAKKHAAAAAGVDGSTPVKARKRASTGGGKGKAAAAAAAESEESASEPEEDFIDEEQYAVEMDEDAPAGPEADWEEVDLDGEEAAWQPTPLRAASSASSAAAAGSLGGGGSASKKARAGDSSIGSGSNPWSAGGSSSKSRAQVAPSDDFDLGDAHADFDRASHSSEDLPLRGATQKTKREPSSARLQQKRPAAAAARGAAGTPPPRRFAASSAAKKFAQQHDDDDFLDDGEEVAPHGLESDDAEFQAALRQSTIDF